MNEAIKFDAYISNINKKANFMACFLRRIILLEIKIIMTNGITKINNSWIVRLMEYRMDLKFNGI